jgi:hypothetical protein
MLRGLFHRGKSTIKHDRSGSRSNRPTSWNKSKPRDAPLSPIETIPYELLESILVLAWHGEDGLPGNTTFVFDNPIDMQQALNVVSNAASLGAAGLGVTQLQTNPYKDLSSSIKATGAGYTTTKSATTYIQLSLVCRTWHSIMRDVVRMHVSLPNLRKFDQYMRFISLQRPPAIVGNLQTDQQEASSPKNSAEQQTTLSEEAISNRRLCRSIHFDIPTGNLTMVPSWNDVPPIIKSLPLLTHIMITAAEPHPALHALLAELPPTVTTLDIHISSQYKYKKPQLLQNRRYFGSESLRNGVANVKHLLLNVNDPDLLESLLEGFGVSAEKLKEEEESGTILGTGAAGVASGEPLASAGKVPPKTIYSSNALQTLIVYGPHDLNASCFTNTVAHSSTIHTLKIYPHSSRPAISDPFKHWNAVVALTNEVRFPRLEQLVVHLSRFEETTPELDEIKRVCLKRGVQVQVEKTPFGLPL